MTANHLEHEIATFPRITGAGRIGVSGRPAIAYSRVDTGRNPSAGPSNSNFPASHLDSVGLIAQSYRAFSSPPLWARSISWFAISRAFAALLLRTTGRWALGPCSVAMIDLHSWQMMSAASWSFAS
jgi:hypothetical protein